jgi:hypothetical protein
VRLVLGIVVSLVLGALTSYGQTYLPDALRSLANSSGSWSAVALLVALLPRHRVAAVAAGPLALLALLAGYELTSLARGYAVSLGTVAEWLAAAVVVGPFLGAGGYGLTARVRWPATLGVGVLAGVLAGEGVYGLTTVAETTSPVYWTISLLAGAATPLACRRTRSLVPAYAVALVVALVFLVAYRAL